LEEARANLGGDHQKSNGEKGQQHKWLKKRGNSLGDGLDDQKGG